MFTERSLFQDAEKSTTMIQPQINSD